MLTNLLNKKFSDYLDNLEIHEDSKSIKVSEIIIKKEKRNSGIGTQIMRFITNYADETIKIITLTPSSDFGSDINRLTHFYKKFGFKLNNGNYKSEIYHDKMIRYPNLKGSIHEDSQKTIILNNLRYYLN